MSASTLPGPLALVGSGEFLPGMAEVDRGLLTGLSPRVAVIPTAASPEGESSIRRWFNLAVGHYARLGVELVEVDARDRQAADDPALARLLDGVGLIYLSGGNPGFLADTLRDSLLSRTIGDAWRGGVALAGCSAGAMALGERTISIRGPAISGLGLAGRIATIPHFDKLGFARRMAGALGNLVMTEDDVVVGIDEDTAVVWDPVSRTWTVSGAAKAWVLGSTGSRGDGFAHGQCIPLPPPL